MIPHIHRRTFGSGGRSVLAIHCSLAHSGAWRGMGAVVGDMATLHAFDLPNHGQSGDWDGNGGMDDTATAMARTVLADLGPEPIDIIGHSFGAALALRLAVEHPDKVRTLTMFEPVYFAPLVADDPDFLPRYQEDTRDFDAALNAGDRMLAAQLFNRTWGDAQTWAAIPHATRAYMAARIHFIRDSHSFLLLDSASLMGAGRFEAVTAPALMLSGDGSPWARDVNAAIARRLPNARDGVLTGVGHMGPITHAAQVGAEVRTFLEQHP